MSAFSDSLGALSTSLITEFGEVCTFTRSVKGVYDAATSKTTETSITTVTATCVPETYKLEEIDEANVRRGDTKLLVGPLVGFEPVSGDLVSFDSRTYRVITVETTSVNSEIVLFTLQCRE